MSVEYIERELTRAEIEQRKTDVFTLLGERDGYLSTVDEYKREIKETKVDIARLDARVSQLRDEIRSGKVYEPRRTQLEFEDVRHSDTLVERPVDLDYPVQHADPDGNPLPDPREAEPAKPRRRGGKGKP